MSSKIEIAIVWNIADFNKCIVSSDDVISIETIGWWFWRKYRIFYISR